jgi:hypothetical protein
MPSSVRGSAVLLLAASVALAAGPGRADAGPTIAGCPVFPDDHVLNTRIDNVPVHPRSAQYVESIGLDGVLRADFGSGLFNGGPIGIPFNVVPGSQPDVPIDFGDEARDESDPGPYPIPPDALIEGGPASGGDRHVLVIDRDRCRLYEMFSSFPQPDGSWQAYSGAVFALDSHALRPATFTSADAAGLPIFPTLVRYDEVATGEIRHAIRFTAQRTQRLFVWPARHFASSITDPNVPPMGQRFRLRASFDITPFPPDVRVILQALKTYGLILADNGSNWFLSGAPDERWDNDVLRALLDVRGQHFEAVDPSGLLIDPNSGQARTDGGGPTGPSLAVTVNQTSFRTGETLRVGLSASNPGAPLAVDLYVLGQLPDGVSAVFLASLASPVFAPALLSADPRTFAAAARGVTLPQGFQTTLDPIFAYTFTGAEPPGQYVVTVALTAAGALADGVVGAGDILALVTAQFTFAP